MKMLKIMDDPSGELVMNCQKFLPPKFVLYGNKVLEKHKYSGM